MWCGQSFKTLEDMTRHMRVTQHYTNIISQEQIISWKTPEDKLAQAHVNAVLTCKVCDESFGSLKELSNHIIKNAHYKEHIIRSMTEGGHGRRRQTRERRKKSLPVRKLLELERMELVGKEGGEGEGTSGGGGGRGDHEGEMEGDESCSSGERASSASPSPAPTSFQSAVHPSSSPSLLPPPPPPPAHQNSSHHHHPHHPPSSSSHHSISNLKSSSSRSAKNDYNNHHHPHQMIINPTEITGSRSSSTSSSSSSMITCDECNEKLDAKNFIAHIKICKSLPSSSVDRKSPSLTKSSPPPHQILLPSSPARVNVNTINLSSSLKVPTSSSSSSPLSTNANNKNKEIINSSNNNKDSEGGIRIKVEPTTGSSILSSFGLNHQGSADEPLVSSGNSPPMGSGSFLSSIEKLIEKSFDSKSRRNQTTGILQRLGIDEEVCPPWQSLSGSSPTSGHQGGPGGHSSGPSFASWSAQLEKYSFHNLKERLSTSPVPSGASSSCIGARGENGSLSSSASSCDDSNSSLGPSPHPLLKLQQLHSESSANQNTNHTNSKQHNRNRKISITEAKLPATGSPSAAALAAAAAAAATTTKSTSGTGALELTVTESKGPKSRTSSSKDDPTKGISNLHAPPSSSSSSSFPMSSMISRLEETIARITGPTSTSSSSTPNMTMTSTTTPMIGSNNINRSTKSNHNNSQLTSNSPSPSSVHSNSSNPGTPLANHHHHHSATHHQSSRSHHHRSSPSTRKQQQNTSHHSTSSSSSHRSHHYLTHSTHRSDPLSSPPPPPATSSTTTTTTTISKVTPHSQLSLLSKLHQQTDLTITKSPIKRESLSELSEDDQQLIGPHSPKRRFRSRSEEESAGSPDRSNPISPESLRSPGVSTPDSIDSERSQAEDLSKIK